MRSRKIFNIPFHIILLFLGLVASQAKGADFDVLPLNYADDIAVYEVVGNYDAELPDGSNNVIPRQEIIKEFYKTHPDDYDFLVIFSNFDFQMPQDEIIAFYQAVKNDVLGIGQELTDNTSLYGSNGILQGTIDMGNIKSIVSDPLDPHFSDTMSTLSHELLHRWAASITFKGDDNSINKGLLGKDGSHWSFLLDTAGSLEYGNRWLNNGNDTFTSLAGRRYLSPLDMYLMGFIDKSAVDPMLLINNPEIDPERMPEAGITITGIPQYVSIESIIEAEGERTPSAVDSQKTFKVGCVFVVRPDSYSESSLYGMRDIMRGWSLWFSGLTDGLGKIVVDNSPLQNLPENPGPNLPGIDPRIAPPEINEGVAWLLENQQEDGNWLDSLYTTDRDTVTVLYTLAGYAPAETAVAQGMAWLEKRDMANLDYLARKIYLFGSLGQDVSGLVTTLIKMQNPDGGWGSNKSYESNADDTALVLKALWTTGEISAVVIDRAVQYLQSSQNDDGGWGREEHSHIQTSIDVIVALITLKNSYDLDTLLQNTLSWVYSKQNADGGFGNSSSTIYDTAKTLVALKQIGIASEVIDGAVSYILERQEQNGSWASSAYQTALAVNSIWIAMRDPDLSVSTEQIIPSPHTISSLPADLSLSVTVRNLGMTEVSDVKVVLFEGTVDDSSRIGETLISIDGQSAQTLDFSTIITHGSPHHYYVKVDPDDLIRESSEQNNSALRIVSPESTYDFAVSSGNIAVTPTVGDILQPLTVAATIQNNGTVDAFSVPLYLVADDGTGLITVAMETIDLPAGKGVDYSHVWIPEISGVGLSLAVVLDPHGGFAESNEENNRAAVVIDINGSTKPDLSLSYTNMTFDPAPALEGGAISLKAEVFNRGFSQATDVQVDFYEGVPEESENTLLGTIVIPTIASGESAEAALEWTNILVAGERVITVVLDPQNLIDEISEENNSAFITLPVLTLPDLAVNDSAISFSPEAPREGEPVTVSVLIQNRGEQPAKNFPVSFYEGTRLIGTSAMLEIEANGQETASIVFDTDGKVGITEVEVIIDPEGILHEQDRTNNRATRSVGVQNVNLWLSERFISPNGDGVKESTEFGYRLAVAQDVTVVVVDKKSERVREYAGPNFLDTTYVLLTWDGLDDTGKVVDDGQYQIQVLSANGSLLASLLVTVDTNRSSLLEAIGTPYLYQSEINEFLRDNKWIWFPDESGILFYLETTNENIPEYSTGLYTMSPTGSEITRLVPWEWNTEFQEETGYRFRINSSDCEPAKWGGFFPSDQVNPGFSLTEDGLSIAFILERYNRISGQIEASELWTVDRFGGDLQQLASYDQTESEQRIITDVFWAPDGGSIAFKTYDQLAGQYWITLMRADGSDKKEIGADWSPENGYDYALYWSPDSTHIAFVETGRLSVVDFAGSTETVMTLGEEGTFVDWLTSSRLLVRDLIDKWTQSAWIADLGSGNEPYCIGEHFDIPSNSYNSQQCIRSGGTLYNTSVMPSGHFLISVDMGNYPYSKYKICNADGICQDGLILSYWWSNFSLSPDSRNLIHNFYDGLLEVYHMDTQNTDVSVIGDWACDIDWERQFPDRPSSVNILPQEGECDLKAFMEVVRWNWLTDTTYLARYYGTPEGLVAFDFATRERKYLPESWSQDKLMLSPGGRYISYASNYNNDEKYYETTHINGSLLNLIADLRPSKTESAVTIHGIAADLNFSYWKLEYADRATPDDWRIIVPPMESPVVNGLLSAWIPPYEGSFLVRLTVADKAGNTTWDRKSVTWGKQFTVTNIYKTGELFSPNDDGIKDTVALNYFVHDPIHLQLSIYDQAGSLIKTFIQNHALPGEYGIVWDGRDESGGIVPDGYYIIRIFDYEFFFQVDTTAPDAQLEFSPVSCEAESIVTSTLSGLALDENLKSWSIYYGDGESPQEWYEVKSGDSFLVKTDKGDKIVLDESGNPLMAFVQNFKPETSPSIGFLGNRTYRIIVEDFAGNQSVVTIPFREEMLVLYRWDDQGFDLEKSEQGGCEFSDLLPMGYLSPATHTLTVIETLNKPISSATVQYRMNMQWHDVEEIFEPPNGEIDLPFDTSSLVLDDIAAVRIKVKDGTGIEYYTNTVVVNPPLFQAVMGCYPPVPGPDFPVSIDIKLLLPEDLERITYQITSTISGAAEWVDFNQTGVVVAGVPMDPSPLQFWTPSPQSLPEDSGYPFRFVGIGESGRVYLSNELPDPPLPCGEGETPPEETDAITLKVAYGAEKSLCNSMAESTAWVYLEYSPHNGSLGLPDYVRYYFQEKGEWHFLKQFDPAVEGWSVGASIDTSDLPEGEYRVKVDFVYGESVVEGFRQDTVMVDHTLPEARITYPAPGIPLCARRIVDEQGEICENCVSIEGIAGDANKIQGYSIVFGKGSVPSEWFSVDGMIPCSPEKGDCRYLNQESQFGGLYEWDVSKVEPLEYSLQLMVTDTTGNTSCFVTQAMVDTSIALAANTDTSIFSPNGDGIKDEVALEYHVGEYVVVDISVVKGNTLVRTFVSAQGIAHSSETLSWDGLNDAGVMVADGDYQIHIEARDSCDNIWERNFPITVDNTPPLTLISFPGTGELLKVVTEVRGTASDRHLVRYQLHVKDEGGEEGPILLNEGDIFIEDDILGIWNTFGLEGNWVLMLSAEDLAGNNRITQLPVSFGTRSQLISRVEAEPRLFSPNNDDTLDQTTILYELTDAANITVAIEDLHGSTIFGNTQLNALSGSHQFQWHGLDTAGNRVTDGIYTLKVTAESVTPPFVVQVEEITLVTDTSPPTIVVTTPVDSSYYSGKVEVQMALSDLNLQEHSITISGGQETLLFDTVVVGSEIVFSQALDLPDGVYVIQGNAKDSADNVSSQTVTFTVDKTRPRIGIESPAEDEFYGGSRYAVPIRSVIEEINLQSYRVQYGFGATPTEWVDITSGETLPSDNLLATWMVGEEQMIVDGDYTIRVIALDKAGWESVAQVTIHVDNNGPELAVITPAEGGYVKEQFDIIGTVTDPFLQGFRLEVANTVCADAVTWSLLRSGTQAIGDSRIASIHALPSDGVYCLRLSATDYLENSSVSEVNFSIDTTPPAPPVLSGSLEGSGISLQWQGNSEADLAEFKLYRNNELVASVPITETIFQDRDLGENKYCYTVRSVDLAGWESEDSNPLVFTVDLTPPEAQIHSPRDGIPVSNYVDITGRAYSVDDFKEYRVSYGPGEDPQSWQLLRKSPVPVSYGLLLRWDVIGLEQGLYTIRLEAEDLNGNVNAKVARVTVDNVAPAAPVLLTATPEGTTVDLSWQPNSEADLAGYLVFRSGQLANESETVIGDLTPYLLKETTFQDVDVADGSHEYSLVAMDDAGNMSDQSNSMTVSINTHAPHLNIISPSAGLKFDKPILVAAESEDSDIATVQFQYQHSTDLTWITFGPLVTQKPYVLSLDPSDLGWEYGAYRLRAVASDQGGLSDEVPQEVEIHFTDITPPVSPSEITAQVNGGFVTLSWNQNQEEDLAGYNIYYAGNLDSPINTSLLTDTSSVIPALDTGGFNNGDHLFRITAVDASGNESGKSSVTATVFSPVLDQPYSQVNVPTITVSGHTVPGGQVEIFRNQISGSESLGTVQADGDGLFAMTITLTEMDNSLYAVATDSAGNISRPSNTRVVNYNTPPTTPTGLVADVTGYDVALFWNVNPETDLLGYNLYRNSKKINPTEEVSSGNYFASAYSANAYLAADGNSETYWNSYWYRATFGPVWWDMYFENEVFLSSIEIEWGTSSTGILLAGKDYLVQALSNGAWNDVVHVVDNSSKLNRHDFERPVKAERVRIYVTDSTDSSTYKTLQLAEVRISQETFINPESYVDAALPDGTYAYRVSAVDGFGSESPLSQQVEVVVGDVIPPAAPENLTVSSAGSGCELSWNDNTEPDLAGYNIYRLTGSEWGRLNSSLLAASSYIDSGLQNNMYSYRVTAVDTVGNESSPSNESLVVIDEQLPEAPTQLTAVFVSGGKAIELCWNISTDSVDGYLLYRSLTTGGPYVEVGEDMIRASCYQDSGLVDGTEYFYVAQAIDALGNASDYSNEASAVPQDDIAPEKPSLFLPTISGRSYQSPADRGSVAGLSEGGTTVHLIHDQELTDTVETSGEQVHKTFFLTDSPIYETVSAPDGRGVYYVLRENTSSPYLYHTYHKDLETGVVTRIDEIPAGSRSHTVSPDGSKIAYCYENELGWDKIGVYDLVTNVAGPVTTAVDINEWEPAWSRDGTKIVFESDRGDGFDDIWMYDLTSGELTRVTQGFQGYASGISADNQKVSFLVWDSVNRQENLYLADANGAAPLLLEEDVNWSGYYPSFEWSPLVNKLAFTANRDGVYDIYVFDADTGDTSRLTNSESVELCPQWSPDGRYLSYYVEYETGTGVRMVSADGQVEDHSLFSFEGTIWSDFNWMPAGIFYRAGSALHEITPAGTFVFEDVFFHVGKNIFTAWAEDAAGHASPPADELEVNLAPETMPDLEVLDQDVFILPNAPFAGEDATIGIVVRNRSAVEAENVSVEIYLWDAHDNIELIHAETIASLDHSSEEWFSFNWDSTDMVGLNTLYVVLDPADEIAESLEENNMAVHNFYVAEEAGIVFDTTLNGQEFGSDEQVSIVVDMHNSGRDNDVHLAVSIEDENGVTVEEIAGLDRTLPYGANERVGLSWDAGSVFAGTYQVKTVLFDNITGFIGEQTDVFTVLPDIEVGVVLTTDKRHYGPDKNVLFEFAVSNQGTNAILPDLKIKLTVSDTVLVRHVEEHSLVNLYPMDSASITSSWNTAWNVPGMYTASIEVFLDNERVAQCTTEFEIVSVVEISGNISVDPKVIFQDGGVEVDYTLVSSGNVGAGTFMLKLLVLDTRDWTAVSSHEEEITLGMNDRISGQHEFANLPWELGVYRVLLQSFREDEIKSLANASFTVLDAVAPVVSIFSPLAGTVVNAAFDLSVTAVDEGSGVAEVEYQIDTESWLPLPLVNPNTGRYSVRWLTDEADEGAHTVRFRATDQAGNTSLPVQTSLVIRPRVDMSTTLDKESCGMNEELAVSLELVNIAWQKQVHLTVQIETQNGVPVALVADEDLLLAANGHSSREDTWNSGAVEAGQYYVRSLLMKNGTLLTENLVPFVIDKVLVLHGTLSAPSVPFGEPVAVEWLLSNNGNFDISELTVETMLTDQALAQLQTWREIKSLQKGESVSGSFSIQTQGMGLGSYMLKQRAGYQSQDFVLAEAQFELIDITAPLVSIVAPVGGAVIDGAIEVVAKATDDAAGVDSVEYRVDQGDWQPLVISDPFGNTYSTLWTPVESDEGTRTISFRGRDKSANISEPIAVTVLVELCNPFDNLAGSLTVFPEPLYYSEDVELEYTLVNPCSKTLNDLNIKAVVLDSATGEKVYEEITTSDIQPGSNSVGSFVLSSLDLNVQQYSVVLEIYEADNPSKELAASSFEVLAAIETENSPHDQTNLLVWLNTSQESCGEHGFLGRYDDDEDDENEEGEGSTHFHKSCEEGCASYARIQNVLEQVTGYYMTVCSQNDFERELRNPFYTDVLIISDQQQRAGQPNQEFVELREKIYSGTGLISFAWSGSGGYLGDDGENGCNPYHESIFGITNKGMLSGADHTITFADSPVFTAWELNIKSKLIRVEAADDAEVMGWVVDDCDRGSGNSENHKSRWGGKTCEYPAVVFHQYGLGQTVYTAFDLCQAFNEVTDEQLTDFLTESLDFVHRTDTGTDLVPYQIRPFALEVTSPGLDFNLQVNGSCSSEIILFDPASDDWIEEYPWETTLSIEEGETVGLPYYLLAPNQEGVFTCDFQTGFVVGDQYTLLQQSPYEFVVDKDRNSLFKEAMTAIESLDVSWRDELKKRVALHFLRKVLMRTQRSAKYTEMNISDISKAIDSLLLINSAEVHDIRLLLDTLLRVEQARYYLYE